MGGGERKRGRFLTYPETLVKNAAKIFTDFQIFHEETN